MVSNEQLTDGLRNLQAIAFDVDGTLTDGRITWSPNGEEFKTFAFPDIMGISLLRRLGLKMALISGESVPQVDQFAKKMYIRRESGHIPRRPARDLRGRDVFLMRPPE